jgi:DNA polymerase III subunit delta'
MPFRDIVGHRSLLALLSRSIEREALPQTLMFAGPSGVGKRLVAGAVAQAINCLTPRRSAGSSADGITVDACGTCAACSRIARGMHPDVLVLEPGDNGSIKIDVVRDVIERSGYRPFEGRRRVVIIDEADAMVAGAQNALLKTLEEPPSASAFILVTSRPDALLITVRSRCPRLRFRPLDLDDVAAVLRSRGKSEIEARTVAASAEGSIGRALDASAEELLEARDVAVRVLMHAAASDDPRRRIESGKELVATAGAGGAVDREQLATHLRAMSSLLRDVELLAAGGDRAALANADLAGPLDRLSAFRGDRGIQAFEVVDRALVALERNAGVKIVADWVVLNL